MAAQTPTAEPPKAAPAAAGGRTIEAARPAAAPAPAPAATLPPANGERRKRVFLIGGAILLVLALALGVPWYLHAQQYESTDDAFITADVTYVSPRVAGQVIKVLINDNQLVKAGDLLVQLDPSDYQTQVDNLQAQLDEAEAANQASAYELSQTQQSAVATLQQAQAAVSSAQADIAKAQAQLMADQALAVKAADDYQRYSSLLATGDVTPSEVDQYRAASVSANAIAAADAKVIDARQADLAEAKAQLDAANVVPQQIGQKKSNYSSTTAKIAEIQAELAQAKLNLSYCNIYATVGGYITNKSVEPGDYVTVGQNLLGLVPSDMYVIANFKETQLTYMKPGDPVTIRVDTYPNVTFDGYVQSMQAGTGAEFSLLPPENATGNYVKVVQRVPVKILFKD
ncbi:MAG TPA: HlyD family secretion protein, partial [Phycisphaerae bacterium]|nr:HlyD family secretion protein [Phycisphaerae bacterium]